MKKTILMILAIILSAGAQAQQSPLSKIFDAYSGKDGYVTVTVSRAMFDLFKAMAGDDGDQDFKEITGKLNSIKILSADDSKSESVGNNFYKEIVKTLSVPGYEDLMTINDGGEEVKFIIRKNGDKIAELVMIVGGQDPCLIALDGDIDLKEVAKLSKSMNIKGLDRLNDIDKKKTKPQP